MVEVGAFAVCGSTATFGLVAGTYKGGLLGVRFNEEERIEISDTGDITHTE